MSAFAARIRYVCACLVNVTCCVGNGIVDSGVIAVQAAPAVAVDRHCLPHALEVSSTVVDACNGV